MKKCGLCKKIKSLNNFGLNKSIKDGYCVYCKECWKIYMEKWRIKHPDETRTIEIRYWEKIKKEKPWSITLSSIKKRCLNSKNKRYDDYGGRGIKCLITEKELKELWCRDKAYLMKCATIDRDDNDGHYEFDNCRYIEKSENSSKQFKDKKNKLNKEVGNVK